MRCTNLRPAHSPLAMAIWALATGGLVGPSPAAAQALTCDPSWTRLEIPGATPDTLPTPPPGDRLTVGEVRLGVGHLRPVDQGYLQGWTRWTRLPLFSRPGAQTPALWLADGWIVQEGRPARPLGTSGMVETGYETPSFVVLERRSDGWIRIRYGPGDEGAAWTHECALDLGRHRLVVEGWEERLTSSEVSPLYFVTEVPHSLRARPSRDGEHVFTIPAFPAEYQIDPVEVRGDWMRVRVTTPRTYCAAPDDIDPETYEGWIRWRDADRGPWLWYYTRGC